MSLLLENTLRPIDVAKAPRSAFQHVRNLENKPVGSVEEGKQMVCEDVAHTDVEAREFPLIMPMLGPQMCCLQVKIMITRSKALKNAFGTR